MDRHLREDAAELRDHGHPCSTQSILGGDVGYVHPVAEHPSGAHFRQAVDSPEHRGLARAVGSDDADDLSFGNLEVECVR